MASRAEGFNFDSPEPENAKADSETIDGGQKVVGGEIVGSPDLSWEETRFNIAAQVGVPPETIKLPQYDGVPLDPSEAYAAGKTSIAIAAQRWNFPRVSTGDEATGPVLH